MATKDIIWSNTLCCWKVFHKTSKGARTQITTLDQAQNERKKKTTINRFKNSCCWTLFWVIVYIKLVYTISKEMGKQTQVVSNVFSFMHYTMRTKATNLLFLIYLITHITNVDGFQGMFALTMMYQVQTWRIWICYK